MLLIINDITKGSKNFSYFLLAGFYIALTHITTGDALSSHFPDDK